MSAAKLHRYPGVRPFSIGDNEIFFGREDDTIKLFKLLMLEKIVILFGRSGYGKSSLINAGIIPKLKNTNYSERYGYQVLEIRIGKISGENESPVNKVLAKLNEQFPDLEQWAFLNEHSNKVSLWNSFKRKQSDTNRKFILIFDQFEEFFNYSSSEQDEFNWQLTELLYTEIPQQIREKSDEIADDEYTLLTSLLDIKILFSIRADRLSLLHSMKDALPNILSSCYEISSLNKSQAEDAIRKPARIESDKYITHHFRYDDKSLQRILKELEELSNIQPDGSKIIETFHLQIICQACENRIAEKFALGEKDEEINEEDLPKFKNLYEDYYRRQIEKLPKDLQSSAQTILEDELIFMNDENNERHRVPVDENVLRKKIKSLGVPDKSNLLGEMLSAFLIRSERNTVGGFSYELSHDTLIEPVLKVKHQRERLNEEIKIKKDVLNRVANKRKKGFIYIGSFLVLLFVFVLGFSYVYFFFTLLLNPRSTTPSVRLKNRLSQVVDSIQNKNLTSAKSFYWDSTIKAWEASQIIYAAQGVMPDSIARDTITNNFITVTSNLMDSSCCCWAQERKIGKDIRPSSWIVSTIGDLHLTDSFRCDLIRFFLDTQLDNGAWGMIPIPKDQTKYGSTYATCHALRALHNSLSNIRDSSEKTHAQNEIYAAVQWLLKNRKNKNEALWTDYPENNKYEDILSQGLSALVIHTLNTIDVPDSIQREITILNREWLNNLKISQSLISITYKEQSNMPYKLNKGVPDLTDPTNHLIIPWQIIATVDAYKNGCFVRKLQACKWLDNVIKNLNIDVINETPDYVKAEVLISLRYLQGSNFVFH